MTPEWWYDLKNGIWALRKWFPTIWGYRPWSYEYTLEILQKSLELQANQLEMCQRHVGYEENVETIRKVIDALKRIREDGYYWKVLDVIEGGEKIKAIFANLAETCLEHKWTDEENAIWKAAHSKEKELLQEDANFAFDTIKTEFKKWWD